MIYWHLIFICVSVWLKRENKYKRYQDTMIRFERNYCLFMSGLGLSQLENILYI